MFFSVDGTHENYYELMEARQSNIKWCYSEKLAYLNDIKIVKTVF